MKKGCWIADIGVTGPPNVPEFMVAGEPALNKYGARYLARGGEYCAPESWLRARHAAIEFEACQKALDCCNSPDYRKAASLRQQYSKPDIVVLQGN